MLLINAVRCHTQRFSFENGRCGRRPAGPHCWGLWGCESRRISTKNAGPSRAPRRRRVLGTPRTHIRCSRQSEYLAEAILSLYYVTSGNMSPNLSTSRRWEWIMTTKLSWGSGKRNEFDLKNRGWFWSIFSLFCPLLNPSPVPRRVAITLRQRWCCVYTHLDRHVWENLPLDGQFFVYWFS